MMDSAISGFMIDLGIQGVEGSWSVENSLLEPYISDPQREGSKHTNAMSVSTGGTFSA